MRQCLFCDSTKLSREHVWPDWIVQLFRGNMPRRRDLYQARRTIRGHADHTWLASDITLKRRIVCAKCNNGWMSDLETCSIPVLKPLILSAMSDHSMTALDRCTLAAWVTLRSMVMESLRPTGHPGYYTQTERVAFHTDPEIIAPPENTLIWIAPILDRPWEVNCDLINYFSSADGIGFHVTTGFINQFAFQLTTSRGHERRISASRMNADGWNKVTRRIWPIRRGRTIDWPPTHYLTRRGYEGFTNWFRPQALRSNSQGG